MLNKSNCLAKHRRTKIVATLGPASEGVENLEALIRAGVNVVRLNFSHGTHEEQKVRIENVRQAAQNCKTVVGLLADLQGPKIRIARFKNGEIVLQSGDTFTLDAALGVDEGDQHAVGIDYKELPQDVSSEDIILLNDGLITLRVTSVDHMKIHCEVISGGKLSNNKGINRQGGGLSAPALTQKDVDDLAFAVSCEVDYIAVSFPRDKGDIEKARALLEKHNSDAGIIAKIERIEAVENLVEIIKASDGVMVARGDLAVEIGEAEVPLVQKEIIQQARSLDKPVIVATQMMESMIDNPVPTRAEVSDVANAVLDNADAVMLSAETAVGKYPVKTIEVMSRVCLRVEVQPTSQVSGHRVECRFERIDEAIAMATMYTANHLDVSAVLALTESGATPLWMSRIRTKMNIYGMSRSIRSLGKMCLYRGVYPVYFDLYKCNRDNLNRMTVQRIVDLGYISEGDRVILTKGDLMGIGGHANAMKVLQVGEVV
jgi:pyruvate kinase